MNPMLVAVICTSTLYTISAIEYVYRTWTRKSTPTPATWVLMFISFSEAVWLYWHTANHSLAGNIGNIAGWTNVCFIFTGVSLRHLVDGTFRLAFDEFQLKCLRAGGGIFLLWLVTVTLKIPHGAEIAYVLTQLLALVAYVPTVQKLRKATRSPEPITIWLAVLIACLCAIYPAIVKQDWKAWLYLTRAIPSAGYVVWLIHGLNKKEGSP